MRAPLQIVSCRRPAWSLIELVAVLALLSVFMVLIVAGLAGALRTEKAGASAFRNIAAQSALADRFRADVASARDAPKELDGVVAGPGCLILVRDQGSHIVYRWEKDRLTRSAQSAKSKAEQHFPIGAKGVGVEFSHSVTTASHTITLRVKGRSVLEYTAALAGDRR